MTTTSNPEQTNGSDSGSPSPTLPVKIDSESNPNQYLVYPEPDGYDRPVNPYGQH